MSEQQKFSPEVVAEAERQFAILQQGTEKIEPEGGLLLKLKEAIRDNRPLKVKLGADPTAPDLHLGHSVILRKMRQFQELGHKVQFLIGGYTALIGDPSGRNKTRPPLTEAQINENAETYMAQVFKVLEKDEATLEILNNTTWLSKLDFADTIKLCAQVTVARIIEREDFSTRLAEGTPISMHELLYPIMQGYDSVAMECDIELGGTDQTFNCLMGRQLMQSRDMSPQIVMTFPLLEGTDGKDKMSKSKGNYIALQDEPNQMFGKIMSIPDELTEKYFRLLTDVDVNTLPSHPMDAKKLLGRTIVEMYHDEAAAKAAQEDFETRFSKNAIPDELPEKDVQTEGGEIGLVKLLVSLEFAESNKAAKRLIEGGAVKINQEKMGDPQATITASEAIVVQAGKRKMARVTLS